MTADGTTDLNLVTDSWIPVLLRDGSSDEMSLQDVLARAPEISRIVGELPTIDAAIEAILQVVLRRALPEYRVAGPQAAERAAVRYWHDWSKAADHASEYLEEWGHRFGLLDPVAPFYQVAGLESRKGEVAGLEMVFADVPNGSPFLSMRRAEGIESMTLAEGARWLIHAQAFDTAGIRGATVGDRRDKGGKIYPIGPGWSARLGILSPRHGRLSEDLLMALAPTGVGRLSFDPAADLPAWEREPGTSRPEGIPDVLWDKGTVEEIRAHRRSPAGPSDVLTWQSRRMRLRAEDDRITGVVLTNGDPLDPQDRFDVEPRSAWRFSAPQTKKKGAPVYMPRELDPSSRLWRGIESLFPSSVTKTQVSKNETAVKFYGPATSEWIATLSEALEDEGDLVTVGFDATGVVLGSNMSMVDDLVKDELILPAALLREENTKFRVAVQDWVQRAENVATAVGGFAADLARAAGADSTDGQFGEAKRLYLDEAEQGFRQLLARLDLSSYEAAEAVGEAWSEQLRRQALRQARDLLSQVSPEALLGRDSGGRYITAGRAEQWLRGRLVKILGRAERPSEMDADERKEAE